VNISLLRWLGLVLAILTLTLLLSGCVATVGEYGYYDGGDYYEPSGVYYGGWGPDYYVAPFRGGDHRHEGERHTTREGGHTAPVYRSAPATHSIPSIPSRSRPGGSRSQSRPTRR
jgi:hypothetical protein